MISAIGAEAQRFLHPLFGMSTTLPYSRAVAPDSSRLSPSAQDSFTLLNTAQPKFGYFTTVTNTVNADTTVSSLTPEVFGKDLGNKLIVTYSNGFDPNKYNPLEVQPKEFRVPYFNPSTYNVQIKQVQGYEVMLTPKALGGTPQMVLRVVNPEQLDTWKPNPASKSYEILQDKSLPTEGIAIQLHLTGKDAVTPVAFVYPPRTGEAGWNNRDYPRHLIVAGAGSRLYFTPSQGQPVQIAVGQEPNPLPPDPYKPAEREKAKKDNIVLQDEILRLKSVNAEVIKNLVSNTTVLLLLGGAATRFELTQLGQSKTQAPFMRHTVVNDANGISESTQLPVSLAQRMVYQVAKHGFRNIVLHSANVSMPGIRQIHDFAQHLNADTAFQTEFRNYLLSMGITSGSWPTLKVGVLHENSPSNLGTGTATAIPLTAAGQPVQTVAAAINQDALNLESPDGLRMDKPILVVPNDSFIRDVRLDLMLLDHARQKALFTLGVYPVEQSRVQAFGTLKVAPPEGQEDQYLADSGKIVGFQEKLPLDKLKAAYKLAQHPDNYLCNTSIYVISPDGSQILNALHKIQSNSPNLRSELGMVLDFGGDVFPAVVTLQSYLEKGPTGHIGLNSRGQQMHTEYLEKYKDLPNKPTGLAKEVKTNYRAMALYDQLTTDQNKLLEKVFNQPVYAHKFNGYWNDAGNLRDFIIAEMAAASGTEVKPDVSYLQKSADHLLLPAAQEDLNHMAGAHQSVLVQPLAGNVMKMLRDYYGFASTGPVAVTGVVPNSQLVARTERLQQQTT